MIINLIIIDYLIIIIIIIHRHRIDYKNILDRETGKYVKTPYTFFTSSGSYLDYRCETIFNHLNNDVKSQIKIYANLIPIILMLL